MSWADNSKIDKICGSAIPMQIFTITMHISNFVKIHSDLLIFLLWNKNMDVLQADNCAAGTQHQNDVVSTSMRRDHVASTLIRHHFNVVCLLGVKWRNLLKSNPNPNIHNINAHIKFGENPLRFAQGIVLQLYTDVLRADNSVKKWQICPLATQNHISTISMHIPSLVKLHWYSLKLSSGNENTEVSRTDSSVKI